MSPIDAICILPMVGLGAFYGYLILKPMMQTRAQARFSSRFQLSDFFWLAVLLQMPLLFLAAIHRRLRNRMFGTNEAVVYVLVDCLH